MIVIVRGQPRPPFVADLILGLLAIIGHIGRVLGAVVAGMMFFLLYLDYMPTIIERWAEDPPDKLVADNWALFLLTLGSLIGSAGLGWAVWRATTGLADFPDRIMPKGWVRPPRPKGQQPQPVSWPAFRQAVGLRRLLWVATGGGFAVAGLTAYLAGAPGLYWPLLLLGVVVGLTGVLVAFRRFEEWQWVTGPGLTLESTEELRR